MVQEFGNKGIYDGSDGCNSFSIACQPFQNQLFEFHEHVNTVLRETYHDSEDEVKMANLLLSLPPLGLTLRQTPFFLDLIQTRVFPGEKSKFTTAETNQNKTQSMCEREKMKAVNFAALLLRIGSWQRVARNEGDLVAKFYYAKRKLVWEILEKSLKSKIEVQWSDVVGMRAILEENQPGVLEMELSQPPTFYKETNPQPRKHTLWNASLDFTDGQALLNRRHYLEFPPGVLDKHYEKLLQRESRFFAMSKRSFPIEAYPYFNFPFGFNGNGHEMNTAMELLPYPCLPKPFGPAHHPHEMHEPTNQPSISIYSCASPISEDFISSSHGEMHTLANDHVHELLPFDTRNQDNCVISRQNYDLIMCREGAVSQNWLLDGQVPGNIVSNLLSDSQVECTESNQLQLQPLSWQLPAGSQNNIPLYPPFPLIHHK